MRASAIYLTVLSTVATLVSSRPSVSYLTQSFWALTSLSHKRQSSTPSQCTSTCDPVQNEVNAGCPITACCIQSFETSYYNCLLCVGTAENATDYTQAQTDIDQLYVACYDYGYSLQELTFPGQNPSRTLSTSSPSTSAGAASAPAPTSTSVPTSASAPTSALTPTGSTSISKTTILPSSASSASSGTANGTVTSSTSTSTTSSAALGLNAGSGDWALIAAAIGLTVLQNIS